MTEAIAFGNVAVEVDEGDISSQPGFDAVVNAANAQLLPGAGVAGAIHRTAGPGLVEECRPLAPIAPGTCVITSGHSLLNPWVIHCLGPVYGADVPSASLLSSCYRSALELADERRLESVAFPAISTGVFGYPLAEAASVAIGAVAEVAPRLTFVRRVRFVLFGAEAYGAFEEALRVVGNEQR